MVMIFTILGVGVTTMWIMKFIDMLEHPKRKKRD